MLLWSLPVFCTVLHFEYPRGSFFFFLFFFLLDEDSPPLEAQRLQAAFSAAETGAPWRMRSSSRFISASSSDSISARTVASRAGRQGVASTSCSTVRRCTRSCGLTSTRRSGRVPPSSDTLSSARSKNCVPGSWGVGCSGTSPCSASRSQPPALAILCPRGAVWCVNSARAMAIDCRSCLKAARSRRPLRRCAAPAARSTFIMSTARDRLNR